MKSHTSISAKLCTGDTLMFFSRFILYKPKTYISKASKIPSKKIEADIILALVLPTIVTPPFSLFSSQVEDPMPEIHGTWLE